MIAWETLDVTRKNGDFMIFTVMVIHMTGLVVSNMNFKFSIIKKGCHPSH